MIIYNSVIIGGGVSGLTVAYKMKLVGKRITVVERGRDLFNRKRESPYDVANGIGGAGLYSDGKLSFYPSATELWKLEERDLHDAYSFFKDFMENFSIDVGEYPDIEEKTEKEERVWFKRYESIQMSLEQRMGIVYRMAMVVGAEALMTETDVTKITKSDGRYEIETIHNGQKSVLIAESIIIAGGKHCFDFLKDLMSNVTIKNSFNKTEVGIRIECDNESFDYFSDSQQDVKLISKSDSGRDVRTFCCCRDGVVLQSESYGLNGYNGSSGEQSATI